MKTEEKKICCLCGKKFEGYGNNPSPGKEKGSCCNECNLNTVILARINQLRGER